MEPHFDDMMCLSRAATSIKADWESGKLPTTRVRRRISLFTRISSFGGAGKEPVFASNYKGLYTAFC